MKPIFNDYQKKLSDIILENNAISPLSELYSNEIRELAGVRIIHFPLINLELIHLFTLIPNTKSGYKIPCEKNLLKSQKSLN